MLRDEAKPKQEDQWEKLAELAGVIDSATFSLLTDEYASVYLDGRAKKINEFMFKANGMEAWNRSMRISATNRRKVHGGPQQVRAYTASAGCVTWASSLASCRWTSTATSSRTSAW